MDRDNDTCHGNGVGPTARKRSSTGSSRVRLAEWWQELLGYEHVGLDDDFFDLGGQSLIVVRLFSKIKKTYGVNFNRRPCSRLRHDPEARPAHS